MPLELAPYMTIGVALLVQLCVPLVLLTAGLCWLLSSLGVFMRDIGQFIQVAVQLLFFLTPITYPLSLFDSPRAKWALKFVRLNPMVPIVESFRRVVNDGVAPEWGSLAVVTLIGLVMAVLGYAWFIKIKRAFADVI